MKKLLLAAVVLVFASSTISIAALKFPKELIGDWCLENGVMQMITSDFLSFGTEAGMHECRLINRTMKSHEGVKGWTLRMRCDPGVPYPRGPKGGKRGHDH